MNKLWAASLAAFAACAASEAQAAKYLIVDISAVGTGNGSIGSRTGTRPTTYYTFTTFFASLAYNLEAIYPPRIINGNLTLVGTIMQPTVVGISMPTGFGFDVSSQSGFLNYDIEGKGCFANSAPTSVPTGTPTLDASCSQITARYSDGFAVAGYDFRGVVDGMTFRVVDAAELPNITFSIPEPSSWALMIAGFGMVGYALRRRRAGLAFA